MVGTDYPYSNFLPAEGMVIQIDERAQVLGRRAPTVLGVTGSARPTLELLLDKVAARPTPYLGTTSPTNVTGGMRCWTSRLTSSAARTESIRRGGSRAQRSRASRCDLRVRHRAEYAAVSELDPAKPDRSASSAPFNNAAVGTAPGQANGIQALD